MKIYLVEDCGNNPGRIYACMVEEAAADQLAEAIAHQFDTECEVVERTLIYGQAPVLGFNE